MTQVKIFAGTFLGIFASITLVVIAFPLAFAFLFWDIKFLLKDEFALIFWLVIRTGALAAAFMALIISLSPDVREAAYERKRAKDALKARMKAK
jgi:hypothetical protein